MTGSSAAKGATESTALQGAATIFGGEGNDTLSGGPGTREDYFRGDQGSDTVTYAERTGEVFVNLREGFALDAGEPGEDALLEGLRT